MGDWDSNRRFTVGIIIAGTAPDKSDTKADICRSLSGWHKDIDYRSMTHITSEARGVNYV